MKKAKTSRRKSGYLLSGVVGLLLTTTVQTAGAHADLPRRSGSRNDPGRLGVPVRKSSSKRKNNIVKVVNDPSKRIVQVIVKDIADKTVDFYVFDLEGTLLINYKLKSREKKTIKTLEKGDYVYNAFYGDEETDAGRIVIR
ncbi:MAG TPA: hypothetical protein VG870_07320 [Chitinophagaceae bacterium]|nr:hypothetical protein [Chitinophagaceae bacterium]